MKDVASQPKSNSSFSEDKMTAVSEERTEASLESDKKLPSAAVPTEETAKSDDATSIPDEDSRELQPLLMELEIRTKDGAKRLEVRQGDDVHELVARMCLDLGLTDKELEAAVEYKVKRALASEQHNMFPY